MGLSATVVFPPSTPAGTPQCVCVTILDDTIAEDTEHFILSLSSSSPDVFLNSSSATVSIIDTGIYIIDQVLSLLLNSTLGEILRFGFLSTNTTVRENGGMVDICVVLLTAASFLTPITLQLAYDDGRGNIITL